MIKSFSEFSTNALLKIGDEELLQNFDTPKPIGLYTFIWATESHVNVVVDGVPIELRQHQILTLTAIQHFQFVSGNGLLVYQFNREFYCIKDHDQEVSCVGLLFFGNDTIPIVTLDKKEQDKFNMLHEVFIDEIDTEDTIQSEMLRMLMARFIIKITRLLKSDNGMENFQKKTNDTLRQFNILVETHFKKEHSVTFYANQLNKSPKTLSNSFAKYSRSPLQIIHDRLILETKRQLLYTDKSAKEIAYNIGFEDPSHLSRLFKKQTSQTLTAFKEKQASII
ncbi:helix-turn-helix domain-containing protein [Winogradskyella sp. A3E31]|uniref:helix-turn-helix domain-containing protein n=1 Tax=Winogradskyella sp. A3E31 TaxID=3349637 RepID=UPI00398AFE25